MSALMDVQLIEQETEDFSSPKNLLLRLAGASISVEHSPMQLEIDPELSLGLSLGGWFATEPREIRLLRSSSNASPLAFTSETQIPRVPAQISRTFSLPPGVDEESRKRKEIQTMDMVEVKRKRKEKRGGSRLPMKVVGIEVPEEPALLAERRQHSSEFNGRMPEGSDISSLSISSNVTSLANTGHKLIAVDPLLTRIRSVNSLQENDNILKTTTVNLARPKDTGWNLMDEMPCVSVKGAPPHYRRIDGFLYKYRQGEEIRIVCVCHGSFFTPAEFVKHAGGGDVAHPLRHIVVNPCPSVYY